jgi:transcription elongation factor Elf1
VGPSFSVWCTVRGPTCSRSYTASHSQFAVSPALAEPVDIYAKWMDENERQNEEGGELEEQSEDDEFDVKEELKHKARLVMSAA